MQTVQIEFRADFIDLGVGQPAASLLPASVIQRAVDHRLAHDAAAYLQYGAEQGDGYFREILAQFLSRCDQTGSANDRDLHNRAGFDITHLYCSLMVRAVATGSIIAEKLELPLNAWEDAHETGGIYVEDTETGECTGQPGNNRAFFEAHYPRLVLPASLGNEGWWNRPFEAKEQRLMRAQRFLQQLLERHGNTEDRVAVVSHGAFYNYLLAAILRLPERDHIWFAINNAAITRIDFGGEHTELIYANRADFMPRELIT